MKSDFKLFLFGFLGAAAVIVLLFVVFISYVTRPVESVAPTAAAPQVEEVVEKPAPHQEPKLVAQLKAAGVKDIPNIPLVYTDDFNMQDQGGWYSISGGINVRPGLDDATERNVVVHEYIHYLQTSGVYTTSEFNSIMAEAKRLYSTDPGMQNKLGSYNESSTGKEAWAYYCTDSSDAWLSQYMLDVCNEYIDRSAIDMAR